MIDYTVFLLGFIGDKGSIRGGFVLDYSRKTLEKLRKNAKKSLKKCRFFHSLKWHL